MRRFLKEADGQSLIMVTLAAVGMIAVMALVLDGGYTYVQRREAQNAVDAGSLAGAQVLSGGVPADQPSRQTLDARVRSEIQRFGSLNAPDGSITVTANYVTTDGQIIAAVGSGETPVQSRGVQVSALTSYPTFFMGVIGITSATVAGQAMAKHPMPVNGGDWAIWTGGRGSCPAGSLSWSGSSSLIDGSIHSNANIEISGGGGGDIINGTVEAVDAAGSAIDPSKVQIVAPVNSLIPAEIQPNPYKFDIADYRPGGAAAVAAGGGHYFEIMGDLDKNAQDVNGKFIQLGGSGNTIRSGLYYVHGNVDFQGIQGGVTGTVTIVSEGTMKFASSNTNLTKWHQGSDSCSLGGLVLFSNYTSSNLCNGAFDAIEFSGASNTFTGIIYAPNGRINFSGSSNGTRTFGMLNALSVNIAGSNLELRSTGVCPPNALTGAYLVR